MCFFLTSSLSFLFSPWLPPRQIQRSDALSRNSRETSKWRTLSQHMQLMTWCSHGDLSVNSLQTVWSHVLHDMSTHICLFRIIRHIYAKYFKEALDKKKCKKASECLIDTVQTGSQSVSRTFRRVRCVSLASVFSPSVTVLWTDTKLQMTFSSSSTAVWCALPAGFTLLVQMWPSPTACVSQGLAARELAC